MSYSRKSASRMARIALIAWAIVRIPLLLSVLYWWRHPILSWVEPRFDIVFVTMFAIDVLSTPVSRLLYASGLAAVLLTLLAVGRARFPRFASGVTVAAAAVIIVSSLYASGAQRRLAVVPLLIIATNLAYRRIVASTGGRALGENLFMLTAVGVAELVAFRRYLVWLIGRLGHGRLAERMATAGIWLDAPALLLAALVAATLVQRYPLVPVEQAVRMPDAVKIVARGDFNWIALDRTSQYLYATGHGLPRLRRYRIHDWSLPALESNVETGGAQTFAYDDAAQEIHTFNLATKQLLSLDAETLALKRSVPVEEIAPGDPWISTDEASDTIAIVSEADERTGTPFVLLNRTTGAILDTQDLDPGNLLQHPVKPLLYMSFFRRVSGIVTYDLRTRTVVGHARSDPRVDRMAFWERGNELLVASPTESRVVRYDADTLAPHGALDTVFGVRVLAVDEPRGLLLCGSLATGFVTVVNLNDPRQETRYYLGPWLRTIAVHSADGVAYVSSRGALYSLQYAPRPSLASAR